MNRFIIGQSIDPGGHKRRENVAADVIFFFNIQNRLICKWTFVLNQWNKSRFIIFNWLDFVWKEDNVADVHLFSLLLFWVIKLDPVPLLELVSNLQSKVARLQDTELEVKQLRDTLQEYNEEFRQVRNQGKVHFLSVIFYYFFFCWLLPFVPRPGERRNLNGSSTNGRMNENATDPRHIDETLRRRSRKWNTRRCSQLPCWARLFLFFF